VAITNAYGIYIEDFSDATITNAYGIYQTGTTGVNILNAKTRFGGLTAPVAVVDVTGDIDATTTIRGQTIFADGDAGGVASTTGLTNATTAVSTGTGTVKMAGSTARNSDLWLKVYVGTTAYYIPAWSVIT